ncbi:hypothetical protein AB0J74_18935 [Asanoa sp. NPDC049573]|uniref:hypothetical protein n=1 Tax=Asanoa sp. NPDC049573 TaxID=3155396 RepID=UPI00343F836D
MTNPTSGAPAPASTIDATFLDIVCHDEELLRAEFDALVAASWDEPPAPPPPAGPRPADNPAPRPTTHPTTEKEVPPESYHPAPAGRRQRSPPADMAS